ncbi:Eco57I restriction-modification methylase domain-containing protein [Thermodesulfovibrio thiophilus]|uniref:Eco57I restriction-modification methylase domain-containing protein n=1 Tax=Thermodesulfovibrio thiophilus TaxID=340095 RepID=UPI0017EBD44F|nr:Eco57I restriction-modification methylase domain-containing protein [Thermodesulfovibrio thiophilus]HHW19761.1 N-6 DNA methylase [Thermodesulfovibrio thiophilus]
MNAKDILQSIIDQPKNEARKFDIYKFIKFFRAKNDRLRYPDETLDYEDVERNFTEGKKLAEGKLDEDEFIVCSFLVNKELTERSSKKAQYNLGKKILKEQQADAGIFIFYDSQGNFRFSLIYTNYLGRRRDWSNFKRFTYFVSPERTNKTFLNQIGEGDFSSLQTIKEAFSVDPVTKQFYNEIQSWYFWAMDKIKFPDDYKYNIDPVRDKEIRNATNLIRLITRIIFIWFLTKKDLVPLDLFSKEKLREIIKDFMKDKNASNFYNAVLQNLFFGTLNQEMAERNFAGNEGYPANRKEYGIKNLYRYADKFLISKNEVLSLFKDIPFLNGGLFDCLDKENEAGKVIYVDGFSRNPAKQSIIPDYLFFQEDEEMVDLSEYGLGKKRPVRGLIEILNSYNFTIDENTPIDQEVALDPELLGKVFENLLASYNPETATSARKSTGSYYTPREIVDYMVEASLFEYLKGKLPETEEEKIKMLLSYSEEIPEFSNEEKQKIISAIDEIKILDPACGSGAFPMGVLHKLVFALQKLDPENKYWRELQYQKALKESEEVFKQDDKNQREERLKEINETFDEGINYPDYARKLYLIENCIYGVDIQPIAIQISKLRFFISLVLDQKVDRGKENFGIKALPNLETRFVAANTLIGLDKHQHLFYTDKIKKLEDDIKSLRHKYFTAKTRREKLNYQEKDKELRKRLAKELKNIGFSSDSSEKIAKFDLYDQNASADFFDPEWMFGIKDGFDVVIANPPYIRQENIRELKPLLQAQGYEVFNSTSDIYTYFYEKGWQVLKQNGLLCFISSNKWMRAKYGEKLRKFLKEKTVLKQIIDFNGYQVFDATVDTNILLFQKAKPSENIVHILNIQPDFTPETDITDYFNSHKLEMKQSEFDSNCFTFADETVMNLKAKIERIGKPLKDWDIKIYRGVLTGFNEAFIVNTETKERLCKEDPKSADILKPILRGRDIGKYYYKWAGLWLIKIESGWTNQNRSKKAPETFFKESYPAVYKHLKTFSNTKGKGKGLYNRDDQGDYWWELRDCDYYDEFEKEKIIYPVIGQNGTFCFDSKGFYNNDKAFFITGKHLKFIIAILNSKLTFEYLLKIGSGLGKEGFEFRKIYVEQLPIPKISESDQKPFIDLVDKILAAKAEDPDADTSELETQIDQMVYKLYGLTDEEIKVIEKFKK